MGFMDALSSFGSGLAGISTADRRLREMQMVLQLQEEQRKQQEAVRQQQVHENKLAAESAERYARTGVREDDILPALTSFVAPSSPGTKWEDLLKVPMETMSAGADRSRPGLYMENPAQSQMEANASALQEEADQKLFREAAGDEALRNLRSTQARNADRNVGIREGELELSQKRFGAQQSSDADQAKYRKKQMDLIDARMEEMRKGGAKELSTGGAMAIAQNVLGDDIDADDPSTISNVTELAHKLQNYFNDPAQARKDVSKRNSQIALEESIDGMEARRQAFIDDRETSGSAGDLWNDLKEMTGLFGEDELTGKAPPPAEVPPGLPAVEGQPDARAMDPNVPLTTLIGADKEVQKAIQGRELKADGERLEWQARHLISLGVPESEMPEDIKAFLAAVRDPEGAMQGLQPQ